MKKYTTDEFLNLVDGSVVDTLYREREDSLGQRTLEDKNKIKELTTNNPVTYEQLLLAIKNLPPHFFHTRKNILDMLDSFLERNNIIVSYDNEKFYKTGFRDGISLILEAIQKEK